MKKSDIRLFKIISVWGSMSEVIDSVKKQVAHIAGRRQQMLYILGIVHFSITVSFG